MNSYELSRNFCDWAFENPHKIKPIHYAIYFFAVEHCNRLGWKENFGLPSQMVMEAIGVKNWRTYSQGLNDLVEFGFIEMVETSKNQYSSNIVAIVKNTKAPTKALDKALSKHSTKHCQSTYKGTVSINKQVNNKTIEQRKQEFAELLKPFVDVYGKDMLNDFYAYWTEHGLNDKKLKFEKEKTFGIPQRLKRWSSNNFNNYNTNQPKEDKLVAEALRQQEMYKDL
jgi:hypothetical protein